MKRVTQLATAFFIGLVGVRAQTSSCSDVVGYVSSKNQGSIGNFHLSIGHEEKAAQTYYYSGPGKINKVRVYGSVGSTGGAPLRVHVYAIDQLGRPKQEISSAEGVFWASDNAQGYISISLPAGGTYIEDDFAIGVTLLNKWPFGTEFQLAYNGDGEGLAQNLASVAGTSTGNNWTSAIDNFDKDGDFYLIPEMTHFLTPLISSSSHCIAVGSPIQFVNESVFTRDSMFNHIADNNYKGSASLYSWNFGDGSALNHSVSPTHAYTTAGAYVATLTVAVDGWSGLCTNSFQFPISVGLSAGINNIIDVTCHGDKNGSISAFSSGGTAPYQYSLDGYYYQSVNTFSSLSAATDTLRVRDALGCQNTAIFTVDEPSKIHLNSVSTTNANCGASDGAILVTAEGGSGSLMYRLNNGSFQSSGAFSNLASGSYVLTIKDANGCTESATILVNNFGSPVLSLTSKTNVSCNGLADGSILVSASGGTGTHQFSINGGSSYQSTGNFTGLAAGTYAVIVRDAAGCGQGLNVIINESLPISFRVTTANSSCAGISDAGLTVHSVTGGIGVFRYSIGGIAYQSSPQFQNLAAGNYDVYAKDAAGCIERESITIQPTPSLQVSVSPSPTSCYGLPDGAVIISASGGNGQYMYSLNGGAYQSISSFHGLTAGTYTYSVRDAEGCTYQNEVIISQPTQIQATISATSATCGVNNGGIIAVASGGSGGGYQYSLDGESYNINGVFNALNSGTYYVTIKDGSSCKRVFSKSVSDANGPVVQSLGYTDVGCHGGNDGTITVNSVSGGTGALEYSINGQNWKSSSSFSGLTAGDYNVFVKDVNGCIGTASTLITEPDAFIITKSVVDVACHDSINGSITVFAAGGSGALAYSIDNGATYQSSNTFTSLKAGIYKVTVRDVAGCTGSIFAIVHEPKAISLTTGVLDVTCHGDGNGSISVNASGGAGNFQFSISNNTFQKSTVFSGLSGGSYSISVKDANNCELVRNVTVNEPDSLELNANIFEVSCAGGDNGAIDISVTGGAGNNEYSWSNDEVVADLFDLKSGQYTLEVTDQNGCSTIESFMVTEPQFPLVINAVVSGTDSKLGAIDATVTGGTAPYAYNWGLEGNKEDIDSLLPGTYLLTVTDASGCISSGQFIVKNTAGIETISDASDAFKVYPNPASSIIHLEWLEKQIGHLEITDVNGRKVYEAKIDKPALDLDVRLFQEGLYYVRVYNKTETAVRRFRVIK
jgi:hypothetical protein